MSDTDLDQGKINVEAPVEYFPMAISMESIIKLWSLKKLAKPPSQSCLSSGYGKILMLQPESRTMILIVSGKITVSPRLCQNSDSVIEVPGPPLWNHAHAATRIKLTGIVSLAIMSWKIILTNSLTIRNWHCCCQRLIGWRRHSSSWFCQVRFYKNIGIFINSEVFLTRNFVVASVFFCTWWFCNLFFFFFTTFWKFLSNIKVGSTCFEPNVPVAKKSLLLTANIFESGPRQGQLQIWTEHSTLIFENLKPVEKSKNNFSIIWKMGVAGLIFEPHPLNFEDQFNFWRCSNDAKIFFWFLYWVQIFKDQCGVFLPYL